MKKFSTLFLMIGLMLVIAVPMQAQKLSKEEKKREKAEKKAWKTKAKNYKKKPLALKNDFDNLQKKNQRLGDEKAKLEEELRMCQSTMDSMYAVQNAKTAELAALSSKFDKLQAAYEAQKNINEKDIQPGLVYKVQVGAFVHFDINKYLAETENFEGESADGMNKYTIGNFRDMAIADNFKKDIRKMGIKDAWIVPFIDGVRVSMDEARKYLDSQGG